MSSHTADMRSLNSSCLLALLLSYASGAMQYRRSVGSDGGDGLTGPPAPRWQPALGFGGQVRSSDQPYSRCHGMPDSFALSDSVVREKAVQGTIFATFTNPGAKHFAINWALQLQTLGIGSLVGASKRLGDESELALAKAGAFVFCSDGPMINHNGQAGRWSEVAPLLRSGLNVLISDSDMIWMRNPLGYFRRAQQAHPNLHFLLCTDRAINSYQSEPMRAPPQALAHHSPQTSSRNASARRVAYVVSTCHTAFSPHVTPHICLHISGLSF